MNVDDERRIEGENFFCLVRRYDRPWGNGVAADVFGMGGELLGTVQFCCHPEFPDFERYQVMATEDLLDVVGERLRIGMRDGKYLAAWANGLHLILRFNAPDMDLAEFREHLGNDA